MKKWIFLALGVLLVAAAGAGWYLFHNLDRLVAHVIETSGSGMTGTAVRVEGVNVSLADGRATLTGLTVANPPGYSDEPAVSLGEISARVDYGTGTIAEIVARAPVIRVETRGGSTNLSDIQAHARQQSGDGAGGSGQGGEPRRYTIGLIEIRDARAIVVSGHAGDPREIAIGDLRFRDLSGTSDEIAAGIVRQLTARVLEKAARSAVRDRLGERLGRELEKLEGLLPGSD